MTAKKRNRNKAKKGQPAANQEEIAIAAPIEAQLQRLQIGNNGNATTTKTCSHGLVLPHPNRQDERDAHETGARRLR